ncbi:hypothetical protein [Parasitella parasitica]|uniref:BHLH domain-containing protein n=1 Tax=Parasitella parasitica TaxID=35722 RepID=A0A0B7NBH5_9FUNG|nr:hypothetical protein [Parasitella parasitica]
MSQDNLFNPDSFQSNGAMYHPDMTLQFAPSVPHRPNAAVSSSPRNPMFFPNQSISNQEALIQQQQFMHAYPPTSSFESPESVAGSSSSTHVRQIQTKAERRAEHNAIERARRESLNVKFQQLAFTLPNLQNDTRPSKSTIIDRTLDFVKNAIQKEERYLRRIKELEKFNSYLLSESDKRLQHKKSKKSHSSPSPVMPAFDASPVVDNASSIHSDKDIQDIDQDNNDEDDDQDDDDEDDDLEEVSQHSQDTTPKFKMNNSPMQQVQFNRVTSATPPNSSTTIPHSTINRNNSNLPVSHSSVPVMPNTTNWPSCKTNVIHAQPLIKEEQMPYNYQLQQQAMLMQKLQAHPPQQQINTTEQEDFHFGSNPQMFTMMNHSFINATTQQHHFMHRR